MLRDQYGTTDSLAAHRGHVTVVMIVTAKRLRNIKPWERDLRERYQQLHVLRIADVPPESQATHDQVAAKLRERVPDEVPILIDLDRTWASALGLDTGRPTLLVVDADGATVAQVRGRHTPELAAEISAALDVVLGQP